EKKKTVRKDAQFMLRLVREDKFPKTRAPSPENREVRQRQCHRHRLVQMRTRIVNRLQALAMNEGKRWKKKLWGERGRAELQKLALAALGFQDLFPFVSYDRRPQLFSGWVQIDSDVPRQIQLS